MTTPVQFGQTTLIIQGKKHLDGVLNARCFFRKQELLDEVEISQVTTQGNTASVSLVGPPLQKVQDEDELDQERHAIGAFLRLLKLSGIPFTKIRLESHDRPDLAKTPLADFQQWR